jgi:protein-disulfide isomerase
MCSWSGLAGVWGGLVLCAATGFGQAGAPKIDKTHVAEYVRYAEGFTPAVQITIDDPTLSPYRGLYRLPVHLTMGTRRMDKVYYISGDGQEIIAGSVWELNQSPFEDALSHLPSSGPSFGPEGAKVSVVVFSDFECPYCRQFAKTLRDNVTKTYPRDVRVTFANFPIESIHPWARAAAEGGACIAAQNLQAFWTFHDWIFQHQGEVTTANVKDKLLGFVKDNGLDAGKVSSCMDTHASARSVNQDIAAGRALQIDQTPTIFINGRLIAGAVHWSALNTLIQMELNAPKNLAQAGAQQRASGE